MLSPEVTSLPRYTSKAWGMRPGGGEHDLEAAQPVPRLARDVVASRLAGWRARLRGDVAQARTVLQRVLTERLTFTPYPGGLGASFEAPARFSGLFSGLLFSGVVLTEPEWPASAMSAEDLRRDAGKGFENLLAENAAIEANYERILARAEAAAKRIVEKG